VQPGTDGKAYQVPVTAALDTGSPTYVLEDDVLVQVQAV
jgi:hypothetical protein